LSNDRLLAIPRVHSATFISPLTVLCHDFAFSRLSEWRKRAICCALSPLTWTGYFAAHIAQHGHGDCFGLAKAWKGAMTPTVALLPWGDFIEDFLDGIGISVDEFCTQMTGGWLFGYIEALRRQGVESSIFCFSSRVKSTVRKVHTPTGASLIVLRAPAAYRRVRPSIKDP
jgi:hypothetical protein